ncbi:hypothetical protein ACYOEI_29540, partial [Singulisphaera rosea]
PITAGTAATPTGQVVSGTLSPANSARLYKFDAQAGDKLLFDNQSFSGGSANWQLIGPYGDTFFNVDANTDIAHVIIPASGTYTLVIGGATGTTVAPSYSFRINFESHTDVPNNSGTPITLGTTVSDMIVPGGSYNYKFTLAAPTRLWFDSQSNDDRVHWDLSGPQGNLSIFNSFFSGDMNLGLLPAGSYSLTVYGDEWISFAFRVLDFAAATPITSGTAVSGTLDPANSTNLYQFSGTAGSTIYLDGSSFTSSQPFGELGLWQLIDPFGATIDSNYITLDSGRITLSSSGTYTLALQGDNDPAGTSDYGFTVRVVSDSTSAMTLGTPVSGSINNPGQARNYTFTLNAPARLWFDSQTNDTNLAWSLSGPQGTALPDTRYFATDEQGLGLLPAGNYTLTVTGVYDYLGSFKFNIVDLASASPITPGTTVNGSLSTASASAYYRFTGTAGSTIFLDALSFSTTDPDGYGATLILLDPIGNQVAIGQWNFDPGRATLTQSGTYTVVVQGIVLATGTANFSFNVRPVADSTAALTLGALVSGNIANPGQQSSYTFTLGAPTRLWFDGLA